MSEERDILGQAIDAVKRQAADSAPPQEVVNKVLAQLPAAPVPAATPGASSIVPTPRRLSFVARWAAAAAVLLLAGYGVGRISAPRQPDIDELRAALLPSLAASLEPAIRQRVFEEATQGYQQAMVTGYVRLKDEFTEQYRADMDRFAVQIFAASNSVTNQLLTQLVGAVEKSQQQDRQWITTALEEIEAKRAAEATELGTALVRLAAHTETQFQRTNDIVRSLANTKPETTTPNTPQIETIN